ncbi:MAG: hypothetical protein KJ799_11800 [Bacteroidetes bacterium]|nr:hypothetical protein [Bacteroidota bacterium]MBU1679644.1 hypothetical protein [Bacteroidota bacterium]MBU2507389.1 hypothetical protein [Bacteroidota bacterium]
MPELNLFQIFTTKLNKLNIQYMVTGSVASIVYGEPRLTHDIDIVLTLSLDKMDEFVNLFAINEFYCPPKEVLKIEILKENRGHCNLIHHETGFKADIYFSGNDEFQLWALNNTKNITLEGLNLPIAPVEYVIIKKLEFYNEGKSQKHLKDIKSILANSSDHINFQLLEKFITQRALSQNWQLVN